MAENSPSLRFDHREIAVIFSLFIFVSLLMFTVGILVGKGLTMAKYDGKVPVPVAHFDTMGQNEQTRAANRMPSSGTSVTTGRPLSGAETLSPKKPAPVARPNTGRQAAVKVIQTKPTELAFEPVGPGSATAQRNANRAFQPIPKAPSKTELDGSLLEPNLDTSDLKAILDNPEIKALLEDEDLPKKKPSRAISSKPTSFERGRYTVQVASYPNEKDAKDRVAKLRGYGYKHAYITSKKLASKKRTWYRVWLGYYPSQDAAKRNADFLQRKGEVKNYLVRKSNKNS